MRKISTVVAALLIAAATFAQAPQGFSYQAVVRDAQNAIVANQTVEVNVTILQGANLESAKAVFTEKHSAKTNANGLFTLTVGSVDAAGFAKIDWGKGSCFLKTESAYGENTTQLMSVPYALYADKAASIDAAQLAQILNGVDMQAVLNFVNKTEINTTLNDYALKTDIPAIPTNVGAFTNDANYITQTDLESRGYLTATETGVNLADYYSKTQVDSKIDDATNKLFTAENGHSFVDLGLPSGTLWATCNVGASRPEEYGGVFAWGETEEKESYTLRNYAFFVDDGYLAFNKYTLYARYGLQDGRVTLENEDDAASAVMGGEWIMPTADQWSELLDNCYFEWTGNYNSTDSAGYIVYKVKAADDKGKFNFPLTETSINTPQEPTASYSFNDVHIFLPASGSNKNHYGYGTAMQYWTSSLFTDSEVEDVIDGESICDYIHAKYVRFSYNGKHPNPISRTRRTQAKSVRGVCVSPSTKVTTSGELKNYYTKSEADDKFALKTNVYTKTEVDEIAQNFGDMPLATVNLTIEGGSDNVGIVKFLGQEWSVNKGEQTATFKVPAYSPVFLTILLHAEDNNHYYTLKLNGNYLDGFTIGENYYPNNGESKINGLIGPFPNSVNTLEIYLDNQAN